MTRKWLRGYGKWVLLLIAVLAWNVWLMPYRYFPPKPLPAGSYSLVTLRNPQYSKGQLVMDVDVHEFRHVGYTVHSGPQSEFMISGRRVDAGEFSRTDRGTDAADLVVGDGGLILNVYAKEFFEEPSETAAGQ